jgi:hypothetical protein
MAQGTRHVGVMRKGFQQTVTWTILGLVIVSLVVTLIPPA